MILNFHRILLFLLIAFFMSGCGKILNQKSFSQVSGLELKWNEQDTIQSFNTSNYPFSGVCAEGFGDVTVSFGSFLDVTVNCENSIFTGSVDLSGEGLVNGESITLKATQVGIPVEAVVVREVNYDLLGAPTILSLVEGSTVLASTQTISGGCEPGATVNIVAGVQGAPLSTICTLGGTYSINAILTQPDGAKTVRANQENGPGTTSPDAIVNLNLSPFGLRLVANATVGFSAGIAVELLSGSNWSIDWGDGTVDTNLTSGISTGDIITHTYSADYIGRVRLENILTTDITGIRLSSGGWAFDLLDLPDSLISFEAGSASRNLITGNPVNIPSSVRFFRLGGNNTLSGDIAGIPASVEEVFISGDNTLNGLVSGFKEGLEVVRIEGDNTISGSISDIPNSTINFTILGDNLISGDLSTLKPTLGLFIVNGNNTITGNTNSIGATSITTLGISGNNTVTGDIANIPLPLSFFSLTGNNTVFGDIADFGNNLEAIRVVGSSVLTGDIANLPTPLRTLIVSSDNSSLSGDIANLPINIETFSTSGLNTVTGDIANLPIGLREFRLTGNNTTFGAINNLPAALISYVNEGNNTTTSIGTSWSSITDGYVRFVLGGSGPRSQTEIDNILIALSSITNWRGSSSAVNLQGVSNSAPSAIGNAAIMTILANGCSGVFVN